VYRLIYGSGVQEKSKLKTWDRRFRFERRDRRMFKEVVKLWTSSHENLIFNWGTHAKLGRTWTFAVHGKKADIIFLIVSVIYGR
jgi:hypothetical protein